MLLPYSTEVVLTRWPFANIAIIAACALVFVLDVLGFIPVGVRAAMVLQGQGWGPCSIFGHLLLHGSFLHLLFNMWFLWIFGNAVCERLGSLLFSVLFLFCGLCSGVFWLMMDGRPAIGASGAIFGIIGFYLALYPLNNVSCAYFVNYCFDTIEIYAFWLILFWFACDLLGILVSASDGIAHYGHVGGFLPGILAGLLALKEGWVPPCYGNMSLLDFLSSWSGPQISSQGRLFETKNVWRPVSRPPSSTPFFKAELEKLPSVGPDEPHDPLDYINVDCPHCWMRLKLFKKLPGSSYKCSSCGGDFKMADGQGNHFIP